MTLDPYKILKISRDAPDEVIRAAYKVLASKYHPDKNPDDKASARMMQYVNDAYALLSDPLRRSKYDENSPDGTKPPESEKNDYGSKKITIRCRSCKRALRVAEHVLSAPQNFKITCPECKNDPFSEPKHHQAQSEEAPKSVINCKNCGQSIRILSAAIHQPERFDVVCPKCNHNPIPENSNYKYAQSPRTHNKQSYIIHPAVQKYNNPGIFSTIKNFAQASFLGLMSFLKISLFAIILIGIASSLFENYTKNTRNNTSSHESTERITPPQAKPAFSQPVLPLPQTGDNTASFSNGVAPLTIRTSQNSGNHYFVKISNTATRQELGSYFIRSGGVLEIKVPVGSYEIKYASGKQWYGTGYLFGPETAYSKADSIFNFGFDGYQYSGYTIELIMQRHGNLRTSGIQANQW